MLNKENENNFIPKFKIGEKVWIIYDTFDSMKEVIVKNKICQHKIKLYGQSEIVEITVHKTSNKWEDFYRVKDTIYINNNGLPECENNAGIIQFFKTKEEAERKIKEYEKEIKRNLRTKQAS